MRKNVVSVSGGKDSTALYLLAMEKLGHDFIPVFADTGNEHEITYEFVRRLAERTGGPEVQWVKADFSKRLEARKATVLGGFSPEDATRIISAIDELEPDSPPFLQCCVQNGRFPDRVKRFCTPHLKINPILKDIQSPLLDAGFEVASWQGIRADESPSRRNKPETEALGDGVIAYRPLLKWTAQDVFAMHKRHGIEPNGLYKLGFLRVGCFPCVLCGRAEIANIAKRFPDHIDKIRYWEQLVRRASEKERTSFFSEKTLPKRYGKRAENTQIDSVVQWALNEKGKHPLINLELPSCQSEYGICE